jgi:hypothetical protein
LFQKSRKSGISPGDILVYLLLAWFSIYAITVCPADTHHDSTICYGLAKYRQMVLDPYLFSIFHRALAHPSVAPHVERVKPGLNTAVRIGKPIVRGTRVAWNSRIVPQWNKRVVPQWNKHVVPQWKKHVVPQLHHVDHIIEPYRTRVTNQYNLYSKYIGPHLRTAETNVRRWRRQAQPYIVLAATKTHQGYHATKPYAKPIWDSIKAGVKQLLLFVRKQRVLFVDPHVARIWEKVKELSSGAPKRSGTVREESTPLRDGSLTNLTSAASIAEQGAAVPPPSLSAIPSEAESSIGAAELPVPAITATAAEPSVATGSTVTTGSSLIAAIESEKVASASSILLESSSPTPVSLTSASLLSETVESPYTEFSAPSQTTNGAVPTSLEAGNEDDIDLDEFARELGLDEADVEPAAEVTETIALPPEHTESEEEKAEKIRQKKIETAKKRADIEGRHSKWESELRELINIKKKSLRKAFVAIRKSAAIALKEHKEIRAAVHGLVAESEKYMKGADVYLRTLKSDSRSDSIKIGLWDKLIAKLDAKFRDRLAEIDNIVSAWYVNVVEDEKQEVSASLPVSIG